MTPTAELLCEKNSRPGDAPAPADQQESGTELAATVIERKPGWHLVDFRELWRYRELLYFLTWRDVKVRYRQTVLGGAWALIQPLATMLVFTLFLGRLANMPEGAPPYPLFAFSGLIAWFFFANAVTSGGQSIVANEKLVTKVYFPRLIIPVTAVGVALVDFVIGFAVLLGLMFFYGFVPGPGLLLVPLFVLALGAAALAVGTLLAALTVAYRDFRAVLPFLIQLWMFATPVIYLPPEGVIGPRGQMLLPLNPAYGLILNLRAAVLGTPFDLYALAVSAAVGAALLVVACLYFRRVERGFADII